MTLRRGPGPGLRRLRALVGAAVLVALVQGPGAGPGPTGVAADGGLAGPTTPGAVPPAPGSGAWGVVAHALFDGPEPPSRLGGPEAGRTAAHPGAETAARRIRADRLARPDHVRVRALLRAGVTGHATALPPPPPSRSPRRG